jgi:hypothetical protein
VSPVSETKPVPGANKLWPKLTTVDSPSMDPLPFCRGLLRDEETF